MKNNRDFQIEKTGYNYRTRKYRDILAVVLDANNKVIDAIAPGTGNHRTTLDWAEWRAESIRNDYPAAIRMEVYCGDEEIAVISFLETPNPDNTPSTMNANEAIANTPANLAKLHALAVNGSPMFYIWLDAVDDAATTSVYLTEDAARADIARLEADDKEAGIYEPDAYRIINAAPYFA